MLRHNLSNLIRRAIEAQIKKTRTMKRIIFKTCLALSGVVLTALCLVTTSTGQLAASELGTVSQAVDGTLISIEYSRPSRRDRDPLFGGVMAYGQVITPGANMATTIEFSKNVTINGNAVPAGKYSVWIGFEEDGWEFGLDETWQRFHGPHPVIDDLEIHFPVQPQEMPLEMETLTFHFPAVRKDGTTLRMHWGTTAIDLDVKVEPTPLVNITAEEAALYEGMYAITVYKNPPWTMYDGSAEVPLTYEGGYLHTILNIGPYTDPHDMALFPKSPQVFYPILLMDGKPAEKFGMVYFEFEVNSSGRAISFEARREDDSIFVSGKRME